MRHPGIWIRSCGIGGLLLQAILATSTVHAGDRSSPDPTFDVFTQMTVEGTRAAGGAALVTPKPAVGWEDGELTAATDASFKLHNTSSHARNLRSQWEGSLVFENNERERRWEDIQKGDLRMVLSHPRGDQFFANFRGTPDLQVVGTGVVLRPDPRFSLHGFAQETIHLRSNGRHRTSYSRIHLDLRLSPRWSVQPAVYRIDARSATHIGWTGYNLFSTFRTTQLRITYEGERSDRYEVLHSQRLGGGWTARTGAQWARWMTNPRRQLLQWGLQYSSVGVDVWHGAEQFALVTQLGPVALGQSWTPRGIQRTLGIHHMSVWMTQTPVGSLDFGVGFSFRGLLRRFAKREVGWNSFAPLHQSANTTPHVRWPGFGSTL